MNSVLQGESHHVGTTTESTANPGDDGRLSPGLRHRGRRGTRSLDRLGRPIAHGRADGRKARLRPAGDRHAAGRRGRTRTAGETRRAIQRRCGVARLAGRRQRRKRSSPCCNTDEHVARLVAIGVGGEGRHSAAAPVEHSRSGGRSGEFHRRHARHFRAHGRRPGPPARTAEVPPSARRGRGIGHLDAGLPPRRAAAPRPRSSTCPTPSSRPAVGWRARSSPSG